MDIICVHSEIYNINHISAIIIVTINYIWEIIVATAHKLTKVSILILLELLFTATILMEIVHSSLKSIVFSNSVSSSIIKIYVNGFLCSILRIYVIYRVIFVFGNIFDEFGTNFFFRKTKWRQNKLYIVENYSRFKLYKHEKNMICNFF